MISRAPSRAMSSITSPSSRSPPNRASISARIFSVGDTRTDTGVVLPSVSLVALEGTYVRCHLHQRRDTTLMGLLRTHVLYSRHSDYRGDPLRGSPETLRGKARP